MIDSKKYLKEAKKTKTSWSKGDIKDIMMESEMAFWGTVSDLVPEAKSGDLDPRATMQLQKAMESAIKLWIETNV